MGIEVTKWWLQVAWIKEEGWVWGQQPYPVESLAKKLTSISNLLTIWPSVLYIQEEEEYSRVISFIVDCS